MKKFTHKIISMLIAVLMIGTMLPVNAMAATCTATINFKVIPVYLDSSKNLGYDVDYDAAWEGTLPCTGTSTHSTNANHFIQIKGFHPETLKLQVRDGYKWAGWIKYTQNLSEENVEKPPFSTYYTWAYDTTDVSGTGTHYIYMVYQAVTPQTQDITLKYNANGGINAPADETKTVATGSTASFSVSSVVPTRDGYTFLGWADSASATTAGYLAGDTINTSSDKTVYAVWKKKPHTHTDGDGDGYCDDDNTCMHEKDENGYCIEEGCEHPHGEDDCCPLAPTPTPTATPTAAPTIDPNEKTSQPDMSKTSDKGDAGVKPGETVHFTLTSRVPDYLGDYIPADEVDEPAMASRSAVVRGSYELVFHDNMDAAFTFNSDVAVKVNGKQLDSSLYTLTTDTKDDCTFHVTMNLVKIYQAGGYFTLEEIENCPKIVVTYSAVLSEDATPGTYKNTASVTFEGDKESQPGETEDKVYGLDVYKYDQTDKEKGLAGAKFELRDGNDNLVATLTSGEDGHVTYTGLLAGTYTLTETEAPEGYVKSDKPLTIVIPDDADTDNIVRVDFANSWIPHTGGTGTGIYMLIGALILGMAAICLVISRRKKSSAD